MKAARFHVAGEPLKVEQVAEPVLRPGSVIVRVLSAFVPPYVSDLVAEGTSFTLPPRPFTPGMDTIGTVEAVADDVPGLGKGERVYCDHYLACGTASAAVGSCFIGCFGMGRGSEALLARWPDGGYAQKLILPAECVTPLKDAETIDPALLCRLGWFGTAYGALRRAGFRSGQTVIINGATGLVGSGGVLLALAMGAGRVVAMGRNKRVLDALAQLDPKRVVPVPANGGQNAAKEIVAAADGADVVLDAVGETDDATSTMNAIRALGPGGTAVLVGGVNSELSIHYLSILNKEMTLCGSIWFPRSAAAEMLAMIARGAVDLGPLSVRRFPLDQVNEALAAAVEERRSGLKHIALVP